MLKAIFAVTRALQHRQLKIKLYQLLGNLKMISLRVGLHCSEKSVVKQLTAPFRGGRSWKVSGTILLPVVVKTSPQLYSRASAITGHELAGMGKD